MANKLFAAWQFDWLFVIRAEKFIIHALVIIQLEQGFSKHIGCWKFQRSDP